MTSKDRNKKTNVNHKKIFGALEGADIKQSTFVSKINKAKKLGEVPFPNKDVQINYEKGLDYIYGTKPLNDQAEDLNPFTSALKKIKPSASESEKLSWFKSDVVEAKNVKELHKTIDQALAAGAMHVMMGNGASQNI